MKFLKFFKTSNNDHFLHTYLKKKSPTAENSPKQKKLPKFDWSHLLSNGTTLDCKLETSSTS
jgi:hypothetical protein